tara:strand:- start:1763 stop:2437 length:675 start_codon:yes stop_codon:yes gene_type:complete
MNIAAIIPASGSGQRFGSQKQFLEINKKPLWLHAVLPFYDSKIIKEIILVVPENFVDNISSKVINLGLNDKLNIVKGGGSRAKSVYNGLMSISASAELICIHDAARPFISHELIMQVIEGVRNNDGAIAAIPVVDTLKKTFKDGYIIRTVNRASLWQAQTPQVFRKNILVTSIKKAIKNNLIYTDESTLMEKFGFRIKVVNGLIGNLKITNESDWGFVKKMFDV